MASIEKWKGNRYRAHWRSPDGRPQSKVFDRRIDAQQHLTAMESSKLMGTYVDPRQGRTSFKEYAEGWKVIQPHRQSSATTTAGLLERHIYPRLGARALGDVRPSHIQALVTECSKTLAPNTVRGIYRIVSAVFASAVDDRLIVASPCTKRVKAPRAAQEEIEPLPVEGVAALIDTIPDRYRALVVVGAGLGPRFSEAVGLTVDRVNWLRRTVTIDRQLLPAGGPPEFGPCKTDSSARKIPAPKTVLAELTRHVATYPPSPDGLIFTGARGNPVRSNTFSDHWVPAVARAGLPEGTGYHALRHFYASLLIHKGASVKRVQRNLGHSSPVTTLSTYSHLWPDDDDTTRSAVDDVLGGLVAPALHGPGPSALEA